MSTRILLIDDDVDDQVIFREIIEEISPDLECIGARNGLEGLDILTRVDPPPASSFLISTCHSSVDWNVWNGSERAIEHPGSQ